MAIANVALTDTFDSWRTKTNQLIIIGNQITEGSLTTTGTITSSNTGTAINVSAGVIRVQGNNFTSNQLTVTSNSYLLTASSTNSGRLGSSIFFNIVGSNSISDVSTSNVATSNAVNALNQSVVAGLVAGNNYTNQVGAASNAWSNTVYVSALQNANNVANASNAYAVTIGSASNTWSNNLSTIDRAIANAAANSANAYSVTVGAASNTWANTYANSLYVSALQNANNVANSSNAFTVTIGASSNGWANTIAQNWANTRLANVVLSSPLTVSWATTSGYTNATISVNTSASLQIGGLGVGTAPSANTGEIRATNNITAYYSDGRLKTIISSISEPISKVKQLSGIMYINNDVAKSYGYGDESLQVGVIAQDVEKVLPQIVKPAPFDTEFVNGQEISKSGENYKTVQYEKLIPLLIEAIKELANEVDTLKSKLGE